MPSVLEKIQDDEAFQKLRIFSICALISSFAFYFFMTLIDPNHRDWFTGRIIVAMLALFGLIASFNRKATLAHRRFILNLISIGYIVMYLYLLTINDWSVFHRWSYFVVIAIMATIVMSWRDYLYTAAVGFFLPVVAGFFSPLTYLELIHFHAANFVTFFVIGLTIRANFQYRNQVVKLTNSLVQNSKMVALGEMSAGLSHEINTPLAIISNSSAQIELALAMPEPKSAVSTANAALEKINKAVYRIARVVQGLHDFSQGSSKEIIRNIDLKNVVRDAVELHAEKFRLNGIELIQNITSDPTICHGQYAQLIQALTNLLNNAHYACLNVSNPQVTIALVADRDIAKISVCDNGVGIPPEIEQQIMQPFFTTKPIGTGTGLGLSIALGIAKSNQGDLYLDRSFSNTCFTLKLPLG